MPKHIAAPVSDTRHRPRHEAGEIRRAVRRDAARAADRRRRRLLVAALAATATAVPLSLHVASAARNDTMIVEDGFDRAVTGGWGTADTGGAYTLTAPGQASVAGGAGVLALQPGRALTAHLASTSVRDVDTTATLSTDETPGGNGLYNELLLRRQPDASAYRVLARVTAGGQLRLGLTRTQGSVTTVLAKEAPTGIAVAPRSQVEVEASITGTDPVVVRARARLAGGAAGGWTVSAQDDSAERIGGGGAIGFNAYLSSKSEPVTARVGHLRAESVDAPAEAPKPRPTPSPATPTPTAERPTPTVTPSATPTPTPPPAEENPAPGRRVAQQAGAGAVGSARYAVPAGAVVASPSGNDSAAGTASAPVRTAARAIAVASNGGTVVLRGGTYHENVTVPAGKRLTIQSWPGEAVWFDGSTRVTTWTAEGGDWVHNGWTASFDSAPCYSPGNCPTGPANQFVNPAWPMAGHPDQVFVDNAPLRQVGSRGDVVPGTFFVDRGAKKIFVGSDPNGHEVVASDLSEALTLRSQGSIVRGIGVRRYATSLARPAAIRLQATGLTVEDVTSVDNAAIGIAVSGTDATLRRVTASRNGILGVGGHLADGLRVSALRAEDNNTEHFNMAPVSGGMKITRSRVLRIDASYFEGNRGPGLWLDESIYDTVVTRTDMIGNAGHGLSYEISAKLMLVDARSIDNGGNGLKLNNSEGIEVWNSTVVGNGRAVWVIQDPRSKSDPSVAGHDKRRPLDDPTMTWLSGKIRIINTVMGSPKASTNCILCVEDGTKKRSAAQMGITVQSDLFTRASSSTPRWVAIWSAGPGNPATYTTFDAFVKATGQGKDSAIVEGPSPLGSNGALLRTPAGLSPTALPADVATVVGRSAGIRHIGAWM